LNLIKFNLRQSVRTSMAIGFQLECVAGSRPYFYEGDELLKVSLLNLWRKTVLKPELSKSKSRKKDLTRAISRGQ
jgi:hypothetical protein